MSDEQHPYESLLRVALAIIASTAAMALALALETRWLLVLVLPVYVLAYVKGRPVARWLLRETQP